MKKISLVISLIIFFKLAVTPSFAKNIFNNFKVPAGYYSKASELCTKIGPSCYNIFNRDTYEKYYSDVYDISDDFDIIPGGIIAIRIAGSETSNVIFEAGE